eukprot:GEMP01065824.1.p1 GENE.GEMP01065824.1~~GEMP01065824.1.p1  ORF type:complete len:139 (+),score=28.42 GEMP01065824.1:105-521(+)
MGQKQSVLEDDEELGLLQDDSYPWFQIVTWAGEGQSPNAVWRWDATMIRDAVSMLTANGPQNFLELCPNGDPIKHFSFDETQAFVQWAQALLAEIPSLREVRFALVPKKLTEETFWHRYFAGVHRTIWDQFLRTDTTE